MNTFWIYLCVIAGTTVAAELSLEDKVQGIKNLVKTLANHTFPTCDLVLFTELADYEAAGEKCKNFHLAAFSQEEGHLATVNDNSKNEYLRMLLNIALPKRKQSKYKYSATRWVWTGLRKTKNLKGKHVKKIDRRIPYNAEDWAWHDGSHPDKFYNWNKGQPDQRPLKKGKKSTKYEESGFCDKKRCRQNQMRVDSDGKWDDAFEFEKHPYACDYQGRYIVSAELKTWDDAKAACEAAGLTLASAHSLEETEELRKALTFFLGESGFENCLGAFGRGREFVLTSHQSHCGTKKKGKVTRWDPVHWAWTGGNDWKVEGNFTWMDGTPAEFEGFPWIAKAGGDNGPKKKGKFDPGQNSLSISKWGEFDDEFGDVERPFACECPRG